jgi:hypothetical protein
MAGDSIQYQTEDGVTVLRLQASDGNVWLSQVTPAEKKVNAEYDAWHARAISAPSAVEQHFVEKTGKAKAFEASYPQRSSRKGERS